MRTLSSNTNKIKLLAIQQGNIAWNWNISFYKNYTRWRRNLLHNALNSVSTNIAWTKNIFKFIARCNFIQYKKCHFKYVIKNIHKQIHLSLWQKRANIFLTKLNISSHVSFSFFICYKSHGRKSFPTYRFLLLSILCKSFLFSTTIFNTSKNNIIICAFTQNKICFVL